MAGARILRCDRRIGAFAQQKRSQRLDLRSPAPYKFFLRTQIAIRRAPRARQLAFRRLRV